MTFTELPHIMVGFQNGTGGNFVGRVLSGIQKGVFSALQYTLEGSAHIPYGEVIMWAGARYIAIPDVDDFVSRASHCAKFIETAEHIQEPVIILMHEVTNFDVFQKLLPNTKLAMITMSSPADALISDINFARKWYMEPMNSRFNITKNEWARMIHARIVKYTGREDIAEMIMSQPNLPVHVECILYFYGKKRTRHNHVANIKPVYPGSIELPFSCFRNNDEDLFLDFVTRVHGLPLTDEERTFVSREFSRYQALQNKELLSDPYKYLNRIETVVYNYLNELKNA